MRGRQRGPDFAGRRSAAFNCCWARRERIENRESSSPFHGEAHLQNGRINTEPAERAGSAATYGSGVGRMRVISSGGGSHRRPAANVTAAARPAPFRRRAVGFDRSRRPCGSPTYRPRNRRSFFQFCSSYYQLLLTQQTGQFRRHDLSALYRAFGDVQYVGNLPVFHFLQISQNYRFPQIRRELLQGRLQDLAGL